MAENTNPTETALAPVKEAPTKPKLGLENQKTPAKPVNRMKVIKLPLTIIAFLLSLPILASFIWLLYVRDYDCEYLLNLHKLQYGIVIGLIFMFFLSLVSLILSMKSRLPMPGLLLVMVPSIVMLIVGLALVGACKTESRSNPGSPEWLKMKVFDDNNWNIIKSCILDKSACTSLALRSYLLKSYDFTTSKLSSIESGCCRPPASCDMTYVNSTFWKREAGWEDSTSNPDDRDCDLWKNDGSILCYNCHACKQGFLKTIQGKWTKLGTFLVTITVLLVIVHLLLFLVSMWETSRF